MGLPMHCPSAGAREVPWSRVGAVRYEEDVDGRVGT